MPEPVGVGRVSVPAPRAPGGRPLRVLHLTTVDMSLWLLLRTELAYDVRAGLEVHGASAPGPYAERLAGLGVLHHALPSLSRRWAPGRDARAAAEVHAVLRAVRPDVLHTHTPKAGVLGRVVGRAARVPVVVNTCHGLWTRPTQPAWLRRSVVTVEGLAARCSHAELYQNAEDARTLRHWARGRQRVVGNGIDLTRFAPDAAARRRIRAAWGLPDDALVVGGVGRLVAEKGVLDLAAAARAFPPRVVTVWVGPRDDATTDVPESLPGPVRLLGPVDDMPAVYNAFDVFVLPSHREGFSRSAMEAAATGLPMVLTDVRGCREIGRHEEHLLLVAPGDPTALASAVGRLADDPLLRARLSAAARERALEEFDQVEVAARSLRAYAAVARARGLGWGEEVPR